MRREWRNGLASRRAARLLAALFKTGFGPLVAALFWCAGASAQQASGDIKVAVVLVNFNDGTVLPPAADYFQGSVFSDQRSANSYFQEVSANRLRLVGVDDVNGDVFGPVTVPRGDVTVCDIRGWSEAARAALPAVDLNRYHKVLYVLPSVYTVCKWGGLGELGGDELWVQHSGSGTPLGTTIHEFGHTFNLHHANRYQCVSPSGLATNKPIFPGAACESLEYGDTYDVMGGSEGQRHFNAWSKVNLGFLPTSNVLNWTQDITLMLAPSETQGAGTKLIKIPRLTPEPTHGYGFYFVEFRQLYGLFDNFLPSDTVLNGVLVRQGADPMDSKPALLDASDAPGFSLLVGERMVLPEAGVAIRVHGVSSTGAHISIDRASDTQAPAVTAVSTQSTGNYTADLRWTTNELAYAQVQYGPSTSYGSTQEFAAANGAITRTLRGLSHQTTYHYRVAVFDDFGNSSVSADATFTTLRDTVAPVIQNLRAVNVGGKFANMAWTTSEDATCEFQYGTSTSYGSTITLGPGAFFSRLVGSLTPATTYHYRVVARDGAGNVTSSPDATFTTTDTVGPVINNLRVVNVGKNIVNMNWWTDELATCEFQYGTTSAYGLSVTRGPTDFFAVLQGGLTPSTTYHYRVVARDAAGNTTISPDGTFTTGDAIAPVIQNLRVVNVFETQVNFAWMTSENATCELQYGLTASYGTTVIRGPSTWFAELRGGLTRGTTYHYRVVARDSFGNVSSSPDATFTTLDRTPPVINNLRAANVGKNLVNMNWWTDELTTSEFQYGTTTAYGTTVTRGPGDFFTLLQGGLTSSTTYHYRVVARDASGNTTTSPDQTFTTLAP